MTSHREVTGSVDSSAFMNMAVRRRDSKSECESFSSGSSSVSTDNSTVNEENIGEIRPHNFEPRFMPNELENMNIEDTNEDVVHHRLQGLDW